MKPVVIIYSLAELKTVLIFFSPFFPYFPSPWSSSRTGNACRETGKFSFDGGNW
jgi:hypothetical protein